MSGSLSPCSQTNWIPQCWRNAKTNFNLKYIVSRTPCAKRNTKRERSWRAEGRQLETGVSRGFVSTRRRNVKTLPPPSDHGSSEPPPYFKMFSKTSFRSLFKNRDLSLTRLGSELPPPSYKNNPRISSREDRELFPRRGETDPLQRNSIVF